MKIHSNLYEMKLSYINYQNFSKQQSLQTTISGRTAVSIAFTSWTQSHQRPLNPYSFYMGFISAIAWVRVRPDDREYNTKYGSRNAPPSSFVYMAAATCGQTVYFWAPSRFNFAGRRGGKWGGGGRASGTLLIDASLASSALWGFNVNSVYKRIFK